MTPRKLPFVSVAVPTRNRAQRLAGCIANLADQRYPHDRFEIVVVDDGSRDETRAVVEQAARRGFGPPVLYVGQVHRGANAARNAALRVAAGDPVCFVDDDVAAPPEWLGRIVTAALGHPAAGCVGGPVRARLDGVPLSAREHRLLGQVALDLGPESCEVRYVWSANMAMWRDAVAAVGPLQEHRLPGHDETEWMDRLHRAQIPVFYAADAEVSHLRSAGDLGGLQLVRGRFVRGVGESIAYHRAGVAYRREAQLAGLREEVHHALHDRDPARLPMAAHLAGRLAARGPLQLWDRVRGRGELAPPPG